MGVPGRRPFSYGDSIEAASEAAMRKADALIAAAKATARAYPNGRPFPHSKRLVTPDEFPYAYPAAARAWELLFGIGWLDHLPPGWRINVHPHDLCAQFPTTILPPFIPQTSVALGVLTALVED